MTSSSHFLTSQRLGFRPWSADDFELAWGLWGDPEVTRLMGGPFSQEHVRERLAREIETLRSLGIQYWPCFLLATGEHVGCCGLRPHKLEERIFAFGFHLRPRHWGRGLASEAARTVLAHAFSMLTLSSLIAGHHPQNDPSRRLLGKLGFKYSHDAIYPPTGLLQPWYSLTAEGFASRLGGRSGPGDAGRR
jgi:ribosomal-protein-alanine N-acetyltransferase